MKPLIKHIDPGREYYTDERCHILELCNAPEDPQASIARARVEPGVATEWHRLVGTTERYVILEGRGLMEVGELPAEEVGAGDTVLIPDGERQRITNVGSGDLVFLCICVPGFAPEMYDSIEAL